MTKRFIYSVLLAAICLSTMVSCSTFGGYTITKRESIDNEIQAARVEVENKLLQIKEKEDKLLRETIVAHTLREQAAADYLFKGSVVFGGLQPELISRPTLVMGQSIQQTASQLPSATPAAQAAAFKALQTELDEKKISTEALKLQYEKELGIAREQGEAKAKALAELELKTKTIEEEKFKVLVKAREVEQTLQQKKDEIQDKDLQDKVKEAENAKKNEKIKMWLMGILLLAAAACGVGAAFVPIPQLKSKLIVGAAVCGGAAIAIPFIEPWMVMIAVGACLLLVGAWIVKNYKDEYSDATDTYRALQEAKTKDPNTFKEALAPVLKEWHTTKDTSKRIDERLKAVGDV